MEKNRAHVIMLLVCVCLYTMAATSVSLDRAFLDVLVPLVFLLCVCLFAILFFRYIDNCSSCECAAIRIIPSSYCILDSCMNSET